MKVSCRNLLVSPVRSDTKINVSFVVFIWGRNHKHKPCCINSDNTLRDTTSKPCGSLCPIFSWAGLSPPFPLSPMCFRSQRRRRNASSTSSRRQLMSHLVSRKTPIGLWITSAGHSCDACAKKHSPPRPCEHSREEYTRTNLNLASFYDGIIPL